MNRNKRESHISIHSNKKKEIPFFHVFFCVCPAFKQGVFFLILSSLESRGTFTDKESSVSLAGRAGDTMRHRERQFRLEELSNVRTTDVGRLDFGHLDDVNRGESGPVTGSHVLVAGGDGIRASQFSVLLVHVVSAGARVVAEPDAKVFDRLGLLLKDLPTHLNI